MNTQRCDRPTEDDDERVIADMSDVAAPSLFGVGNWKRLYHEKHRKKRSPEDQSMSDQDSKLYTKAALLAALAISGVFIVGLGLVVLLMVLLW